MSESTEPAPEASAAAPGWWARAALRARYGAKLLELDGRGLWLVAGLVLIAWASSGIYKVQPNEQGVILRFGRLVETTEPGLHYHWPFPVEQVWLPKVTEVNQIRIGNAAPSTTDGSEDTHAGQMLTGDENIVEAAGTVLWRIKNAGDYLFNIKDTPDAVRVTAESALREIISRTPIQAAMSDKRQQIADQTTELLQRLLDKEHSGVLIVQVQLQRVDPPKEVIDAFIDVQRARADQER
ncbi:MAG: protease modulator HflK, partial [Burkholderiales bacterium]|nr:protease modulator HflK [Burkholderiales bacterium]